MFGIRQATRPKGAVRVTNLVYHGNRASPIPVSDDLAARSVSVPSHPCLPPAEMLVLVYLYSELSIHCPLPKLPRVECFAYNVRRNISQFNFFRVFISHE